MMHLVLFYSLRDEGDSGALGGVSFGTPLLFIAFFQNQGILTPSFLKTYVLRYITEDQWARKRDFRISELVLAT